VHRPRIRLVARGLVLSTLLAGAGCGDDDDDAVADGGGGGVTVPSTDATDVPTSEAPASTPTTATEPACRGAEELAESLPDDHVADDAVVEYDHLPPASGPHAESTPEAGIHAGPVPYVQQVTALELGFVVLQYDPSVPADVVDELTLMSGEIPELVLTPSPGPIDGGATIAATTWQRRLLCDAVDLDELRAFYADRGSSDAGH
jgi:hypothetical protein